MRNMSVNDDNQNQARPKVIGLVLYLSVINGVGIVAR